MSQLICPECGEEIADGAADWLTGTCPQCDEGSLSFEDRANL